jgi:hypothetical protein
VVVFNHYKLSEPFFLDCYELLNFTGGREQCIYGNKEDLSNKQQNTNVIVFDLTRREIDLAIFGERVR